MFKDFLKFIRLRLWLNYIIGNKYQSDEDSFYSILSFDKPVYLRTILCTTRCEMDTWDMEGDSDTTLLSKVSNYLVYHKRYHGVGKNLPADEKRGELGSS